jgi:hypothetical protein
MARNSEYYDRIESEYGLTARRAAEAADKLADSVDEGEMEFGQALQDAVGAAFRPGKLSGR